MVSKTYNPQTMEIKALFIAYSKPTKEGESNVSI
jgi:hypothetical protein